MKSAPCYRLGRSPVGPDKFGGLQVPLGCSWRPQRVGAQHGNRER